VTIRDRKLEVKEPANPKADPNQPGQIGAPIPGVVSTVAVVLNQLLKKGDRLLVMEAMKMQSTVYAPVAGKVTQLLVRPGQHVEAKDLLLSIG
jgi:pyruvate carboxylase